MTPEIFNWAYKYQVPMAALVELRELFGLEGNFPLPEAITGTSEAAVQAAVRLEASQKGVRLWRNNVGALKDKRDVPVRYGLANDTKEMNERLKSADLIGWRPVVITQAMVGSTIAQFVSREIKEHGWHYIGDDHEKAQLAWAMLVTADGGDAGFCDGVGTL